MTDPMLQRSLIAGIAASMMLINGLNPVIAADLSTPEHDWSGAYVGLFAAWQNEKNNFTVDEFIFGTSTSGSQRPTETSLDGNSLGASALIGYQFQFENFILGAEGDFSIRSNEAESTYNYAGSPPIEGFPDGIAAAGTDINVGGKYLATLRGRVGFLVTHDILLFGTGGVAFKYEDVSFDTTNTCCGGDYNWDGSNRNWHIGYAVGGGAEYNLSTHWNARIEYLYVNVPSIDIISRDAGQSGEVTTFTVESEEHHVRVGISYAFSWLKPPSLSPTDEH